MNPVFFPAFGYISIKDTSPTIIPGEAGFGFQNCDDVDVVGHEAVGPDGEVVFLSLFFQDVQVCALVAFLQGDVLSAISPLYDAVRDSRVQLPVQFQSCLHCTRPSPHIQGLLSILFTEVLGFRQFPLNISTNGKGRGDGL